MSGFNLPPGISVNDIPGNRPEDEAEEAFWDAIIEEAEKRQLALPEYWYEQAAFQGLVEIVREIVAKEAFEDGRAEGQFDVGNDMPAALREVKATLLAPFSESDYVPGNIEDAVSIIDAALNGGS